MGGLHCFKERDFSLGNGNGDNGRIGYSEDYRNQIEVVLFRGKAISFPPFSLIKNPSSQEASLVIASPKQTRKLNLKPLSKLFDSQSQEKSPREDLRSSHHQLPILLPKTPKTNPKANHLINPHPSHSTPSSQPQNPCPQNLFNKGDYSVTFNPLFNKSYAQIFQSPNIKENHHQSIDNLTIAIINPTL